MLKRFATLLLFVGSALAQTTGATRFYKLDFVVKELEGTKVLNARAYSTIASTDPKGPGCFIRTGNRVPVPASEGKFNYMDVGVNIDCFPPQEVDGELSLRINAEVSSTVQESAAAHPVIRQNRWGAVVIVPIKKPTVVFSSDDVSTKRQMQVELTATPVK